MIADFIGIELKFTGSSKRCCSWLGDGFPRERSTPQSYNGARWVGWAGSAVHETRATAGPEASATHLGMSSQAVGGGVASNREGVRIVKTLIIGE